MKNIRIFYLKNCHFLVIKFSVYLNRRVFVMKLAHAHLQYVCNTFSMFWKDPMKDFRGVDFTKYTQLTIIESVQLS